MPRVLITGMSGAGKSTLLRALAERGRRTVDTDYEGWTIADGRWDVPRMTALLAAESDLVVSGTVDNQGEFYDRFEHVVLLSAPLHVLLARVGARADNPYGRNEVERVEISRHTATIEPLLRVGATVELDGRAEVTDLVAAIEQLA